MCGGLSPMLKRSCLALAALTTASCATPDTALPTYRDAGIELSGSIEGTLVRDGSCIRVRSTTGSFVPIWPRGTAVTANGVQLPAPNGGELIRFDGPVAMRGGRNPGAGGIRNYNIIGRCGGSAFLVNSARSTQVPR